MSLLVARLLGTLLLMLALFAGGVWYGTSTTNDRRDAKELVAERAAAKVLSAEVARGNALSARLSVAESTIQIKIIERIKYVTKVTTGAPCLSPAAVDLINGVPRPDALPPESSPAGEPVAESTRALAASDSDVATWAIEAHGVYDTCAARLNSLVDFEVGVNINKTLDYPTDSGIIR